MTQAESFLSFDLVDGRLPEFASVIVLGIPEDAEAIRPGCRDAPDVFRRVSLSRDGLAFTSGADLGNTAPQTDWANTLAHVSSLARAREGIPVVLGGGPAVADAALSLWGDHPVIAATPRLCASVRARDVLWLGLHGPQPATVWDDAVRAGQQRLTARQIEAGVQPDWPVLAALWIDAAVFDTGHAAGADGLNPGGVAPEALVDLLATWTGRATGIVLSGAAPARDPRGLTELALTRIVQHVLSHG